MDYLNNLNQRINSQIKSELVVDKVFSKLKEQIYVEYQLNKLEARLNNLMYSSTDFNINNCNQLLVNMLKLKEKLNKEN